MSKPIIHKIIFSVIVLLLLLSQVTFAQLAANKSKFVGNIISNGDGTTQFNRFKKYWNQVTSENAGKWGSVQSGNSSTFNWGGFDNAYNFAKSNNFPFKHHTFIWGQQQPGFINSLDSAAQYVAIVKWIDTVAKRYPNIEMIDVVNEPLPTHAPPDGGGSPARANYKNALGGNGVSGWDWVIKSFELARQHFPDSTILILNDYSILNSTTNTTTYITIINILKEKGLIDGIGCQAHGFETASAATIKTNLDRLGATGVPIYISEFDLNIENNAQQLAKYQELFPVMYEHPAVAGITLWGYIYGATWRPNTHLLDDRNAERPALKWLWEYFAAPFRPATLTPNSIGGISRLPLLTWSPSDSAASYHVQTSLSVTFGTILLDTIVTDTLLQIEDTLAASTRYYWRVSAKKGNAESPFMAGTFVTGTGTTSIEEINLSPKTFLLSQNYPNPFNPATTIQYQLPHSAYLTLKVYDVMGKEVAVLHEGNLPAGSYEATFDGSGLASGIYLYRLQSGNFVETKRLVLLK